MYMYVRMSGKDYCFHTDTLIYVRSNGVLTTYRMSMVHMYIQQYDRAPHFPVGVSVPRRCDPDVPC